MAIIYSYPYDQTITDTDAWVGTDSVNRQTKQYTAKAVADYLNINGKVAIAGQMNYQFVQDPSFKAESQRKDCPKGHDYDHNTKRCVTSSHNRGGTQSKSKKDGTKAERRQNK